MLDDLEAQRPRVEQFRNALLSPAWTETIQPLIAARTDAIGKELLGACKLYNAQEAVAMGQRILELEWFGKYMLSVVQEFDRQWTAATQEAQSDEESAAYEAELVDVGRSNPYYVVQNPDEDVDPDVA